MWEARWRAKGARPSPTNLRVGARANGCFRSRHLPTGGSALARESRLRQAPIRALALPPEGWRSRGNLPGVRFSGRDASPWWEPIVSAIPRQRATSRHPRRSLTVIPVKTGIHRDAMGFDSTARSALCPYTEAHIDAAPQPARNRGGGPRRAPGRRLLAHPAAWSEGGGGCRFLSVSAGRRRPDEDLAKKTAAVASAPPPLRLRAATRRHAPPHPTRHPSRCSIAKPRPPAAPSEAAHTQVLDMVANETSRDY